MTELGSCCVNSALGMIRVEFKNHRIFSLTLGVKELATMPDNEPVAAAYVKQTRQQLEGYFAGKLQNFDLPLDFSGYSEFALAVLQALQAVPFGTTVSYGELANLAGRPGAARAVGRVVGANRTPVLIPCHRVIGSSGKLVGYSAAGGLKTKQWLLAFEQKFRT